MKAYHHRTIKTARQFLETLKAGPYAWPGGYPIYFLTSDGGVLSFDSARDNATYIARAIKDGDHSGWRVEACDINYEDAELICDDTGERIPSAYAD